MNQIEVVQANPEWPQQFGAIADKLRQTLQTEALRIDHIGSTSVHDLAAKDVIDIQISVADLVRERVTAKLIELGYRLSPHASDNLVGLAEGSPDLQKRFLREPSGHRRVHVHVREMGRLNQSYALLFRDFLRSNELIRRAYQMIKLELADKFADDLDSYYAVKDPHMDTIYGAAKLWASQVNWQPDEAFR